MEREALLNEAVERKSDGDKSKAELQAMVAAMEQSHKDLQARIEQAEVGTIDSKFTTLAMSSDQHARAVLGMQEVLEVLQKQSLQQNLLLDGSDERLRKLLMDSKELRQELAVSEGHCAALEATAVRDFQDHQNETKNSDQHLSTVEQRSEALLTNVEELQEEVSKLESELQQSNALAAENEAARRDVAAQAQAGEQRSEALQKNVEELQSEVGKLESELQQSNVIAAEKEEARRAAATRADRVSACCCYACQAVYALPIIVSMLPVAMHALPIIVSMLQGQL